MIRVVRHQSSRLLAVLVLLIASFLSISRSIFVVEARRVVPTVARKSQWLPPVPVCHTTHENKPDDINMADSHNVARGGEKATTPKMSAQRRLTILSGMVLAWNSGYINGCCLSGGLGAAKQGVVAVTGAYTTSALGFASGNTAHFAVAMRVIASFIAGSAIASVLNPRPVLFELSPTLGPAFFLGALLLARSSALASAATPTNKSFLYFAAIANGIQNSITSVHTGNLMRTTHYTGMSSDIGTFLGQVVRGNRQNLYKLQLYVVLVACFWSGGYVSYGATRRMAGSSLLVSAGIYAAIGSALVSHQLLIHKVKVAKYVKIVEMGALYYSKQLWLGVVHFYQLCKSVLVAYAKRTWSSIVRQYQATKPVCVAYVKALWLTILRLQRALWQFMVKRVQAA